jgi:sorting nexin-25
LSGKTATLHAESFEEFIAMINDSIDLDEVKQMRYNILTEIMQATTIENLRRAKGGESADQPVAAPAAPTSSSDLLSPRHMKRYLSQLAHAKGVCERRLNELGCDPNGGGGSIDSISASSSDPFDQSLTFDAVMNSAFTRRFFYSYLQEENQQDLLGFWSAAEELRRADRTLWHQLATEIFYGFVNKPNGAVQVQRPALKRIEAFLVGDSGPDVFFDLQEGVSATLRETHFPAFLISSKCHRMLDEAKASGILIVDPGGQSVSDVTDEVEKSEEREGANADGNEESVQFSGPSGFAKSHLEQVTEKLQNKLQALTVS